MRVRRGDHTASSPPSKDWHKSQGSKHGTELLKMAFKIRFHPSDERFVDPVQAGYRWTSEPSQEGLRSKSSNGYPRTMRWWREMDMRRGSSREHNVWMQRHVRE
jgi:hypothetical protein